MEATVILLASFFRFIFARTNEFCIALICLFRDDIEVSEAG
jgi:hypothetical protein